MPGPARWAPPRRAPRATPGRRRSRPPPLRRRPPAGSPSAWRWQRSREPSSRIGRPPDCRARARARGRQQCADARAADGRLHDARGGRLRARIVRRRRALRRDRARGRRRGPPPDRAERSPSWRRALGGDLVPAYPWLWSAEDDFAGHHRRYTMGRLRSVLEQTGFEPSYATYFFALLTVPILFARSLRYRLGRTPSAAVWKASERQHASHGGARKALDVLLAPELRRIRAGLTMPFGTSCLAIARAR